MELTKIELVGFKSFAKKTTFRIDAPVTGIVGPNGSGKSNVAEAFRFVLGEQSVKSMRGKTGADLIFKGSKGLAQMSRAKVELTFKNTDQENQSSPYASFSEITIGREIYADGGNEYTINGTKVRLKDIQELLAHNNIGSSHHHIISQGEADRVLHASVKDRKEMIQDALGLRVYEWRLKEAEKKLSTVLANMREAEISRREIAPHISFLKKQIEKVQKATELRSELAGLYHSYLAQEEAHIHELESKEPKDFADLQAAIQNITQDIARASQSAKYELPADLSRRIVHNQDTLKTLETKKEQVMRTVVGIETEIRILEQTISKASAPQPAQTHEEKLDEGLVPKKEVSLFAHEVRDIHEKMVWRFEHKEFQELPALFNVLKARITAFETFLTSQHTHKQPAPSIDTSALRERISQLTTSLQEATEQQKTLTEELATALQAKDALEREREQARQDSLQGERAIFELEKKRTELTGKLSLSQMKIEQLKERKDRFEAELAEGAVLVGSIIFQYKNTALAPFDQSIQDEHRKKIERIKLRIEDIGVVNVDEVTKEFESVSGRDQFLNQEIRDLEESKAKLEVVMAELRTTLATTFDTGLKTINNHFQKFFTTMFGGGEASLVLIEREKRTRTKEEEQSDDEEKEMEIGIDVSVSLPHKKVKDINMLSGGERALTSIALLFAMSQVNPPPFLILDETDAALDESNAKKYGAVLHELSAQSKLIAITHNRETMSRTNALYGVTLDVDGSSRILSVKLDEANAYAK